jgi:hypothetical protein
MQISSTPSHTHPNMCVSGRAHHTPGEFPWPLSWLPVSAQWCSSLTLFLFLGGLPSHFLSKVSISFVLDTALPTHLPPTSPTPKCQSSTPSHILSLHPVQALQCQKLPLGWLPLAPTQTIFPFLTLGPVMRAIAGSGGP